MLSRIKQQTDHCTDVAEEGKQAGKIVFGTSKEYESSHIIGEGTVYSMNK